MGKLMATEKQNDWRTPAWMRWQQAVITGDGQFVSLSNCFPNKAARLFATYNEALAENGKPCGHAACHVSNHWVVKLKPIPESRHRERD
jgi:hypothetical protein